MNTAVDLWRSTLTAGAALHEQPNKSGPVREHMAITITISSDFFMDVPPPAFAMLIDISNEVNNRVRALSSAGAAAEGSTRSVDPAFRPGTAMRPTFQSAKRATEEVSRRDVPACLICSAARFADWVVERSCSPA
jgi:hypothetical protein